MIKEHILSERKLWLHLDGNTFDSSNYGNNGIGTGITYESGHIGQCAVFNATTDKILINNASNFAFERTDTFTFSLWFKINAINQIRFLVGNQSSTTFQGISLWQNNNNRLYLQLVGTNTSNLIGVYFNFTTINTWKHLVVTYDGGSSASGVKMYLDGASQTLTVSANTLNTSIVDNVALEIGNRNGAYNFNGYIDEVIVSNKVWTQNEVIDYYNSFF